MSTKRERNKERRGFPWGRTLGLVLCLWLLTIGACAALERSQASRDGAKLPKASPGEAVVALYAAPVPFVSAVAEHGWFVVRPAGSDRWERWEVWQSASGPHEHVLTRSRGMLRDVGAGGTRLIFVWRGPKARALARCIPRVSRTYPYQGWYWWWPGPNSNTYIARVLEACQEPLALPASFLGSWFGSWRRDWET